MVVDNTVKKIFTDASTDDGHPVSRTQTSTLVCSICKSKSVITDPASAEVVCSKCGMVISDKIEEESRPAEWRTLKNRNQAGAGGIQSSLASADMGLSTVIAKENKDASRSNIEPSMLSTMHRLRTWDFRTQ